MSKQQQQITTPPDSKYFHRMLNMADDDLGPYEYRLLGHYIRVGDCWEGVRKTAKITRMSVGKVVSTRNELEKLGYIHVEHREQDTCLVTIIDRMAENVARYSKAFMERTPRSYGEQGVHVVNTSELEGVHVVNERRTRTQEEEPKKKKELTTSAATHQVVATSPSPFSLDEEADDAAMFTPLTEKQKSAQAEKGSKRLSKPTTTPTTPQPPAAPAPVAEVQEFAGKLEQAKDGKAKRKPNHTALVINTVWGKAVSGGLLPMLMGNAKKAPWKDHNIDGGMTEVEIFAFSRWYKKHNPGMNLVEQPHKVWAAVQSFRDAIDYDGWMTEGEKLFPVYFPKETPAKPVVEERATPEEIAEYKQQIQALGLGDVFGDMFDDYKENIS